MGHHHSHILPRSEYRIKAVKKAVWVTFAVNALLMGLKLIFGYTGHSDALVADGFHSLYDFASGLIILFFIPLAAKEPDAHHPYGHGKVETMVSLGIGLLLLAVAAGIAVEGVDAVTEALAGKELERPDVLTIIVTVVAILSKELLFRYSSAMGRKANSSALIANAWHERGDAISSIATLIGVSAAYFLGEKWRILDPVASLFIAVIIGLAAWRIVRPAVSDLLETSLPEDTVKLLFERIASVRGVRKVISIRSRKNGTVPVIDISISVDPENKVADTEIIVREIKEVVAATVEETPIISVETSCS